MANLGCGYAEYELSDLLRRSLLGYRSARRWALTAKVAIADTYIPPGPVPPDIPGLVVMGRHKDRQWSGYGTPAVVPQIIVDGDEHFVRDSMAIYAFDPPPTLGRLDRVVGTSWVRTTRAPARAHGWISPEVELDNWMERVSDTAIEDAPGRPGRR